MFTALTREQPRWREATHTLALLPGGSKFADLLEDDVPVRDEPPI
jgi:hypothetical protein